MNLFGRSDCKLFPLSDDKSFLRAYELSPLAALRRGNQMALKTCFAGVEEGKENCVLYFEFLVVSEPPKSLSQNHPPIDHD